VPLRDYEGFRSYIDKIISGEQNTLWPGRPLYFAKNIRHHQWNKYIPITRDSIPNHIDNARDALFNMMTRLKLKTLFDGKMIFLSDPLFAKKRGGIPTGRLSGIVNHWIPGWLKGINFPLMKRIASKIGKQKWIRLRRKHFTRTCG
jgi:hypothetical protein